MGASVQIFRDPDHFDTVFCGIAWSPNGQWLASESYMLRKAPLLVPITVAEWSYDPSKVCAGSDARTNKLLSAGIAIF